MEIRCIWEHNGFDTLLYAENFIGAYTRGKSLEEAKSKMPTEIKSYLNWRGQPVPDTFDVVIVQEKDSELEIKDADSDVLFYAEENALTLEEYNDLKALALKSAADFLALYESIPDKNKSSLSNRKTFYGNIPRTAEEMYLHTKNVTSYYFGEIGIDVDNEGSILESRQRGFELLEKEPYFLENLTIKGSYDERWTLMKVIRRFVWHDRIHAKAMWRMAKKTFQGVEIEDVFKFRES